MPWVTFDDIEVRWIDASPLPTEESVDALIGDAEMLVRSEFPDIGDRLDDNEPNLLDRVRFVVAQSVLRVLRNPEGARSTTSQTGPLSDTLTFAANDRTGPWLTDDERKLLSGLAGAPRPRAFCIDMTATQPSPTGGLGGARW